MSYDWWMVSYLLANSIQLQQALKLVSLSTQIFPEIVEALFD